MGTMTRLSLFTVLLVISSAASIVSGFSPSIATMSGLSGGSNFAVSQSRSCSAPRPTRSRSGVSSLHMGGGVAKFGIFSPAVYAAKVLLGDLELKKIRGKGISLHSQAIKDFCAWVGATHMQVLLIKRAKVNGDVLGFLV